MSEAARRESEQRAQLARSFDRAADEYERGRPSYPAEAVAWLVDVFALGPGRSVLDLAAGTGKLTRLLVPSGARVVAVEPLDEMRAYVERVAPGARALPGSAEVIPLGDETVDAVTVAQAFHWFDVDRALREIHRVLRPGGGVAVLWNTREESELERRITALIGEHSAEAPRRDEVDPARVLPRSGLFGEVEHRRFRHVQELDDDAFVARFTSISYVAAAPSDERERLVAQLRELVADRPRPLTIPYVADVFVAFRATRPSARRGEPR